jgi:prepilin-type N-terminal cleavage/methylation domain-containing protein
MERGVLSVSVVSTPQRRAARLRRAHGFTLVELAVVVTIVAILSVIALVGYRKYMLNAKITEARNVISAIRLAQEDYRSERGTYAVLGEKFCPAGGGQANIKVGWDTNCDGGKAKWNALPVHVEGAVQFTYATIAGPSADYNTTRPSKPFSWNFVEFSAGREGNWYVVGAECDLDDNSSNGKTQLLGSSLDNQIRSQNDGS